MSIDIVKDLRRAVDELQDLAEDANDLVCIVEDAHGLAYSADQGARPAEGEQGTARSGLPGTLGELARLENAIRREVHVMSRARRTLARIERAGH